MFSIKVADEQTDTHTYTSTDNKGKQAASRTNNSFQSIGQVAQSIDYNNNIFAKSALLVTTVLSCHLYHSLFT